MQNLPLTLKVGGVRIEVVFRRRGSDKGISFNVYGGEHDGSPEVLRFDCFEKSPHYHYLSPHRNKYQRMDRKSIPDPVGWTLESLKRDLPGLLWKAGHRKLSRSINQSAVAHALNSVGRKIIRWKTTGPR